MTIKIFGHVRLKFVFKVQTIDFHLSILKFGHQGHTDY